MRPVQNPLFVLTTVEEVAAQLMQQHFSMTSYQALIQLLSILLDSEYEMDKHTFINGLHLDREQVLLAIRTRYENLQRQRRKSGARGDAGHAFLADAGNEKFGGKSHYPSGFRGHRRGMGREGNRGRGRGARGQIIYGDKSDGTKDCNGKVDSLPASVKCKRCSDDGYRAVRCLRQLCGVCGGKGHVAEICANIVSVLACQAPYKMSGTPVPSGEGLRNKGCALDYQVGGVSVICDDGVSCHMSYSST